MGKPERRRRREAASLAESSPPPALPPTVPTVDTLRRLVDRRGRLEQAIACEVDRLAAAGVSWPQIAAALGVSRQAARQSALRRQSSAACLNSERSSLPDMAHPR